jgi:hypothetical protein
MTEKKQDALVRAQPSNEMEQLQLLIDSKSLPSNIKTIEQAFAIAQFGKDLGLKPMQAFHQIYSIQGRLSLSAKALGGLLWANGISYKTIRDCEKITKEDGKMDLVTTIEFHRNGVTEVANFYWSDAVKAGYTTKDNWVKMAKYMMYARCLSLGANRIAPDKIQGMYTVEEVMDFAPDHNVSFNEEGEITILNK